MIDSHAHVGFRQFDEDRDEVIKRAEEAGLTGWIEVGTDLEHNRKAIALARQQENVWATVGVHPGDVIEAGLTGMGSTKIWAELEDLIKQEKVVAIGEVGLDFFRGGTPAEQIPVLEQFVRLGGKLDRPLIFHMRSGEAGDANELMLNYLELLKDNL